MYRRAGLQLVGSTSAAWVEPEPALRESETASEVYSDFTCSLCKRNVRMSTEKEQREQNRLGYLCRELSNLVKKPDPAELRRLTMAYGHEEVVWMLGVLLEDAQSEA